jgi:hypothetical protein
LYDGGGSAAEAGRHAETAEVLVLPGFIHAGGSSRR